MSCEEHEHPRESLDGWHRFGPDADLWERHRRPIVQSDRDPGVAVRSGDLTIDDFLRGYADVNSADT